MATDDRVRLDKWLWAARFYKTRALAAEEIGRGRITVNEQAAKPARELKPGDVLAVRQGPVTRTVVVRGLSAVRGPQPLVQPHAVIQAHAGSSPSAAPRWPAGRVRPRRCG